MERSNEDLYPVQNGEQVYDETFKQLSVKTFVIPSHDAAMMKITPSRVYSKENHQIA